MSTSVYVAAAYGEKLRAADLAERLRTTGYLIASTWHDRPYEDERAMSDARRGEVEAGLRSDIAMCRVLVALTWCGQPKATYGEACFALEMQKSVVLVHKGFDGRFIFDSHWRVVRVDVAQFAADGDVFPAIDDGIRRAAFR